MLFDLANPKTDVKVLFEDFYKWVIPITEKLKKGELNGVVREITVKHLRLSPLNISPTDSATTWFFRENLVDLWIYFTLIKIKVEKLISGRLMRAATRSLKLGNWPA
jgi:hypothetical protein